MAEVGTATIRIASDVAEFEADLDRLTEKAERLRSLDASWYGRWPTVASYVASLGFVGYIVHILWG